MPIYPPAGRPTRPPVEPPNHPPAYPHTYQHTYGAKWFDLKQVSYFNLIFIILVNLIWQHYDRPTKSLHPFAPSQTRGRGASLQKRGSGEVVFSELTVHTYNDNTKRSAKQVHRMLIIFNVGHHAVKFK